ncbi:MAG: DUF342 domain-containing protein [Deltaproteobacteria bacterium]|nr:DUF342 domain-containing protein [Deltaproteobacteria bacterium]
MSDESPGKEIVTPPIAASSAPGSTLDDLLTSTGAKPAEVQVFLTTDELHANIQAFPPVGDMPHVTVEMIREALGKRKVSIGVDEETIRRVAENREYMKTIQIAEGVPPVNGVDASLIFHYSKNRHVQDRSIENLQAIDMKELDNIVNVEAETLLIEKIPPVGGVAGKTVTGRAILQKRGQDIRLRAGKGVKVDPDGLRYYAERGGEVQFRNNQITVNDVHAVQDVDASTGNVRFNGNIYVAGLVNDGYTVEARGMVRVDGSVGAATIIAEGDVFVAGGIFGSADCRIESKTGNVHAKFAQNATITAAQEIGIEDYAKECRLTAGGAIRIISEKGEHGFIVGGRAQAVQEITANNAGSHLELRTHIEVGIDSETMRVIDESRVWLRESYKKLDAVANALNYLHKQKKQGPEFTEQKRELFEKLLDGLAQSRDHMNDVQENFHSVLVKTIGEARGRITIHHRLYPGVTLRIGGETFDIQRMESAVSFVTGKDGVSKLLARSEGGG